MEKEIPPESFERMRAKYPNAVFVYVSLARNSNLPPLDKQKYVVPKNTTVGQFMYIIRRRLQLSSDRALFIFANDMLPTSSQTMAEVYQQYKSADGILRVVCTSESVFG